MNFLANAFILNMALLIPNNSFQTCGGLEALTSTIFFNKCGGRIHEGWNSTPFQPIDIFPIIGKNYIHLC